MRGQAERLDGPGGFRYIHNMSLFIALEIPLAIRQSIASNCAPFAPVALQTSWVKPAQMHVVLAIIGNSSPAFQPHLKEILTAACAGVKPFACSIRGYGYEGSRRSPLVLWMGVEPYDLLLNLHDHLWGRLKQLGYTRLNERFTPHVRIAYCKSGARNKAVLDAMDDGDDPSFDPWTPECATLLESRTTPRGPEHRALHQAPFAPVSR